MTGGRAPNNTQPLQQVPTQNMPGKENTKSLSIETVIAIVSIVLVVAPLSIFSLFTFQNISQSLTDIIKDELEAKSILVAYDINSFIHERIIDAKVISQADVLEKKDVAAKIQYLTEIVTENEWINDIDIMDSSGTVTASSGIQNEKGKLLWKLYPIEKSLFLAASKARQGQVYVSEAMSLDTGPGILFITPITDDTNTTLIGLLAVEVNLEHISKIVSLFDRGIVGDKYVYIVDNDGRVVVSDDPSVSFLASFPDLQVRPELLEAFSIQGEMGNSIYTDIAGDEVMAGYADMEEFGENDALDWSIITIAPINKITAPVNDLKSLLFITGSVIALLSAFFAYRVVVLFTENLKKISVQADEISKGNYSAQTLVESKRKGALNTLVIAINRMQVNIHQLVNGLEDREQRLSLTLNSIADGVIATDEKGNVTRMNPASELLTGWSINDAEGLPVNEIFPIIDETSRETIENPIEKVISTGDTVFLSNHTTLISKDGSEHLIEDSAAPIRAEDNTIHGMILIFSDVTRRKQAEKQYRQALKMDALGKLTGGVAHDYNNILGVIIGYCDLLNDDLKDQPEALNHVRIIHDSARRGADLTKKLLDFSREKPTKIDTLNIATLLQNQHLMLERSLTVRIDLVFEFDKNLWSVHLDESDLIDSILNICINSMHAIEDTGRLTIRASNESINQFDANSLGIITGDYVLLCITDTGCGMDENTKNRIFDPFFTTKGTKGTGLGLSQVYGFVQRSKGAIKVYSEKGHGTRLALYFPRHHEAETIKQDSQNIPANNITGKETILVVDDEVNLLQFCCTVLEKRGFTVLTAENAKIALSILEREKVGLLLSDIIMPEMDGYQLAAIVKEKYPGIKIQLASGFADERDTDKIDENLKHNILLKPYNSQTLLQTVHRLLETA